MNNETEQGPPSDEFDEAGNFLEKEETELRLEKEYTDKGHKELGFDDQDRMTLEREMFYEDEEALKAGNFTGYEKKYSFVEDGRSKQEFGKNLDRDNEWSIGHQLDKEGRTAERMGEVISGPDTGHRWIERFGQEARTIVWQGDEIEADLDIESGEILEQGTNPNKEPTGHRWTKWVAKKRNSGEYITNWGQKTYPSEEGSPEYGEWGNPPEAIK